MRVKALSLVRSGRRPCGVRAGGPGNQRQRRRQVRRLDDPEQASLPARSGGRPGRLGLVHRAARQHDRPLRSGDTAVQGVRAADAELRAARPAAGRSGQHLVHRQRRRPDRHGRREDRQGHRIQDAEPEGEGSAHHRVPPRRAALLHRAGRQLHRHARSEGAGRQHQADRSADGELAALRRPPRLQGHAVLRRVQLEQDRQHRSEDDGHPRIPAAEQGRAAAAHRHRQGRHGVVRRLRARLPRSSRSEDRQGRGVPSRPAAASRCPTRST